MPRSKKGSKRVDFSNFDFEAFEEAGKEYKERKEKITEKANLDAEDITEPNEYFKQRVGKDRAVECLYEHGAEGTGDIYIPNPKKKGEVDEVLSVLHKCIFSGKHARKLREYLRYLKISEKKFTKIVLSKTYGDGDTIGDPISYNILAKSLKQTFRQIEAEYVAKKKSPWE